MHSKTFWKGFNPSLIRIKQLVNNQAKFSFQPVSVYTVKEVIEGLASNKPTAGEIPIKILKESGFTFEYLTSCVNEAILVLMKQFYLAVKYVKYRFS